MTIKLDHPVKAHLDLIMLAAIFCFLGASASSCASPGPLIDVCVSDPARVGFECRDKKQQPYFLPYEKSENYIAIPPNDFETLVNYCKKNH